MSSYTFKPNPHYTSLNGVHSEAYGHKRKVSTFMRSHTSPRDIRGMIRGTVERVRERITSTRWKDLATFTNCLRVLWILGILWFEKGALSSALSSCDWKKWETWPSFARPARVAVIADPQLVDPHTYPRRGMLLKATQYYTDRYMNRAWNGIQDDLVPEATFFLGDLFDGGREWGGSSSPGGHLRDPREQEDWKSYKGDYWYDEFLRFQRVFPQRPAQKVFNSIPGNHDVGIGDGIDVRVWSRFKSVFGSANQEVVVGNHSFVLLDTVSLANNINPKIFKPSKDFLKTLAERPSTHYYAPEKQDPTPIPSNDKTALAAANAKLSNRPAATPLPRILLSHVPLYRPPNTPCGPTRTNSNPDSDALRLVAGFQYQNVLHSTLSSEILHAVDPILILSGDDHDSCDVIHRETKRVREITVRSISMAMGVRRPGFLLLSAWNSDQLGPDRRMEDTVQTHVCYLPDQIGIFITYAWLGFLTLLAILARALFWKIQPLASSDKDGAEPMLPLYGQRKTSGYAMPSRAGGEEEDKYKPKLKAGGWRTGWRGTRGGRAVRELRDVVGFSAVFYMIMLWLG